MKIPALALIATASSVSAFSVVKPRNQALTHQLPTPTRSVLGGRLQTPRSQVALFVATNTETTTASLDTSLFEDLIQLEKDIEEFEAEARSHKSKSGSLVASVMTAAKKGVFILRLKNLLDKMISFQDVLNCKSAAEALQVVYAADQSFFEDDADDVTRRDVTQEVEEESPMETMKEHELEELVDEDVVTVPTKDETTTFHQFRDLLQKMLIVVGDDSMGYGTYPPHPEFPDVSLAGLPKLMKRKDNAPPPFEYNFSLRKTVRSLKRLLMAKLSIKFAREYRLPKAETAKERYEAWFSPPKDAETEYKNFGVLPRPDRLIREWQNDKEMARQFVAGVNPLVIQVCKDPESQLKSKLMNFFKEQRIDVQKLASEKRLLFASYEEFEKLKVNPHSAFPQKFYGKHRKSGDTSDLRYFHGSKIVFQLDESRKELDILAIELNMDHGKDDYQVFSRNTSPANQWLFAKAHVQMIDAHLHEWINHLGATHLTFEPHIIALHNTLRGKQGTFGFGKRSDHPLWAFFEPLVQDTLFLNWSARDSLARFGDYSVGDMITSTGCGQYMQILQDRWKEYDFFGNSALPNELANRGFDDDFEFPGYLYREDGMKLWNAYGDFTRDFVDEVYQTDEDVANDVRLQEWALETTDKDKGAIRGFPTSFQDKATLAKVMQTLWWVVSGLHAAVNFPQYDYLVYAPNKPLGMRASMNMLQEADGDLDWIFEHAMPDDIAMENTIQIGRVLVMPSNHNIDQLSDHYESTEYGSKSYGKFLKTLDAIGDEIQARNDLNKEAGRAVYYYLHPSRVPASIDI